MARSGNSCCKDFQDFSMNFKQSKLCDGFLLAVLPDDVMRQEGDGGVEEEVADVEGDWVEPKDAMGQSEGEDC